MFKNNFSLSSSSTKERGREKITTENDFWREKTRCGQQQRVVYYTDKMTKIEKKSSESNRIELRDEISNVKFTDIFRRFMKNVVRSKT